MSSPRDRFYLNKSEGKLLGVCAGLADYLGVDALWVRVLVVALTVLGSGVTIPLYLIVAVLASRRPPELAWYERERDEDLRLERLRRRRARSTRLRDDLSEMDRRLADVESSYRASGSRLAGEIDRLR